MSTAAEIDATQPAAAERNNVRWIHDVLIPRLAAEGKLRGEAQSNVVKHVDVQQLSIGDTFMLTLCYKIRVTLAAANGFDDDDALLQLVVKITPDLDEDTMRLFCFTEMFYNEVRAYTVIFPAFGWCDEYPKYYYSHIRPNGAAIVLADFTADSWRMSTSTVNLSLEHILVAVAELGKLHGTMYAKKHTNPDEFRQLCDGLRESRFVADHTIGEWDRRLRIGPQRATAAVRADTNAAVPEAFLQRLEAMLADTFQYQKRTAMRRREPLAVLCHGDFLRNNIAFKYIDEKNDTPSAAMLFDFQTLRYASPMVDLVVFMVNSTGVAVRRPNFAHIFDTYFGAVCHHFGRCSGIRAGDTDFPQFFNRAEFLREYALYLPFGLSVGASFLPILHVPDSTPIAEHWKRSTEWVVADAWGRGGQQLDAELRSIVMEMYELYAEHGLELEADF